jgi:hypothetical protein
LIAFRGAAPKNMKNRGHFADYGEGMRIKTNICTSVFERSAGRKGKAVRRVSTKTSFLLNFFLGISRSAVCKQKCRGRRPRLQGARLNEDTARQVERRYREHNLD